MQGYYPGGPPVSPRQHPRWGKDSAQLLRPGDSAYVAPMVEHRGGNGSTLLCQGKHSSLNRSKVMTKTIEHVVPHFFFVVFFRNLFWGLLYQLTLGSGILIRETLFFFGNVVVPNSQYWHGFARNISTCSIVMLSLVWVRPHWDSQTFLFSDTWSAHPRLVDFFWLIPKSESWRQTKDN